MPRLAHKTALITGGAAGIGLETARLFLKEGARVMIVDLEQAVLDAAAQDLRADGAVLTFAADVSSPEETEAYVLAAISAFGRIDIFFNNAGIEGRVAPLTDQ